MNYFKSQPGTILPSPSQGTFGNGDIFDCPLVGTGQGCRLAFVVHRTAQGRETLLYIREVQSLKGHRKSELSG